MKDNIYKQKINSISKDFADNGFDCFKNVEFFYDDYIETLSTLLSKKAYYGKVALFSLKDSFLALGSGIKRVLAKDRIVTVDFVFDFKEGASVKTLTKIFSLPDDVRAVIVLNGRLSNIADYFAMIKNIPVYCVTSGFDVGKYLENTFYLKNSDEYDKILLDVEKHIIIDKKIKDITGENSALAFDYVMSNVVSLIDLKTSAFFKKKRINAFLYNLKNQIIVETFSVMKSLKKDVDFKLTVNSLIIGAINRCFEFEYSDNDSLINLSTVYYSNCLFEDDVQLAFANKLLELYAVLCKTEEPLPVINDYNDMIEKASLSLNVNQAILYDIFERQTENIKQSVYDFEDFKKKFGSEISQLADAFKKTLSIHTILNGKDIMKKIDEKRLTEAVKVAGLINENVTPLTLFMRQGLINLF